MIQKIKQHLKHMLFSIITYIFGDENGQVLLTTLTGPAKGLRFRLNLKQFIEPLYFYGTYELSEVQAIQRVCRQGWVVWDCGIYLGYYTNLFSRLVGANGQVVAIEPDPRNVERTKANLALNDFRNVQFVQAAIGAPVGEIDFIVSHNTNSHIQGAYIGVDNLDYATRERADDVIKVRCLSLDEAYQDGNLPPPNLIKIDIEGAELEALKYLDKITTEVRPIIVLELHNPECDAAAWEFSQRANYSLESLDRGVPVRCKEDVGGTLLCLPCQKDLCKREALTIVRNKYCPAEALQRRQVEEYVYRARWKR